MNSSNLSHNATLLSTDAPTEGLLLQPYTLLTTVFFSFIILLGLFGNILIMATLVRNRKIRSPCNLLIANICAADLGVCLLAAPLRIIDSFRGWSLGDVMCYILTPLQDVFVTISVVTQTVIALERYRAIVTPFKPKMTLKRVRNLVIVICLSCYLAAGLPMAIFLQNKLYSDGKYYCSPVFTNKGFRVAYEVYLVVTFIVCPLVVQSAAYIGVIRANLPKNENEPNCLQQRTFQYRIRQKKRLVRMLLVLMLAFQVCTLPRGAIMLMYEFTPNIFSNPTFLYFDFIALTMYYIKHIINPFILWAMSSDFRAGCLGLCFH